MKETIKDSNVTFFLNNWKSFKYEEGSMLIYFKGSFVNTNKAFRLESWINNLFRHLANNDHAFNEFLSSELNVLGGFYSFVIIRENKYHIVTDIIRSIPLFYGFIEEQLFITDSLDYYQRGYTPFEIDNDKLEEFIFSGFVYGRNTVYKNVNGMQAGEIVTVSMKNISSERYFKFIPNRNPIDYNKLSEFITKYDDVLILIFSRIIKENPMVRNWIVPLSGGHDSRLTINYLYRLGVRNVICFSYGTPKNEQSVISQQVAEALGYKWYFVEYNENKWNDLHKKGLIDEYISYAFNGVSTPHLQDLLAVHELHVLKIISKDDIFLKSHGDFIAGSQLADLDLKLVTLEDAVNRVILRHSNIKVRSEVSRGEVEEIFRNEEVEPKYFQEYFNWQERQAKFIVNSKKVYEFFGYECLLPYWNKENVDLWLSVPSELRKGRTIFFNAEMSGILMEELKEIPFAGKSIKTHNESAINMVKRVLPSIIVVFLLRLTGRKVRSNEAMNMIYASKAQSVRRILDPLQDFPKPTQVYFKNLLFRRPYQVDAHILTALYTLRKQLDTRQNRKA